ncbi:Glycerol kinase [Dimargaris cristalligena]|uniref:Probable glycerol kinase n=1 Tax=Dimargaris cristalligena TaxID=215637 RepID=A0A4Q0A3E4_9FUNG|nr:Glycerol kinase [Dimargaris cristalligena]RKP40398.1 glycerol kinase [Dimargaris cristalligena]|eukprot:RKP40398.1 glycerol kinase [Dimargaris cristalligena]
MPSFIGAIDQGTTSSRFLIFDKSGVVIASHQLEFPQYFPNVGWVEQNPNEILQSVTHAVEKTVAKFEAKGHSVADIKAIGITNQRETAVAWDRKTGQPLCNAIVWNDTRTKDVVHALADSHPSKDVNCIRDICGLPLTTYFTGVKLRWMLENVPAVKEAQDEGRLMVGTVDSWLIYNLTGGATNGGIHVTDVTNASRTMLMNIRDLKWSDELCSFFQVSREALPKIASSSEVYGHVADGPLKGVPIAGCLGDQQAATVGQKCFSPGEAKNTYGTGCFMIFNTGHELTFSDNGLLSTVAYQLGPDTKPVYALEGSIAVAGSAIKWLRDNMGLIQEAADIGRYASEVSNTGGVYFVTAFSGLFAPYWRDDARGCLIGLTQYANRNHICRATLEAICFQTRAILDAMNADSKQSLSVLKVDGGVTNSDVCMQLQADILGIEVVRPANIETTALGAAFAAGLAVKEWDSIDDIIGSQGDENVVFKPSVDANDRDGRYAKWNEAIKRSYGWA